MMYHTRNYTCITHKTAIEPGSHLLARLYQNGLLRINPTDHPCAMSSLRNTEDAPKSATRPPILPRGVYKRRRFSAAPSKTLGIDADVKVGVAAVSSLLDRSCRSVDCYERLNFIDEGTYGRVFRARDRSSGDIYALKQVKLAGEREGFPLTALREVSTLLSLRHENVVHVREVVVGATMDKVYMVMEFAEHDVRAALERMPHPYSQSEVKSLLQQILRGVSHMHSQWVVHRDLKTANLLLTAGGVVKVADFGLARRVGDPSGELTPNVSTLWYRAPEVLLGATEYSSAVDMWSVGCIFAELVLGEALFPGRGELDQISRVFGLIGAPTEKTWPGLNDLPVAQRIALRGPAVSGLPDALRAKSHGATTPLTGLGVELVAAMLTACPAKRVTAAEALQHPYFDEAPAAKAPHLIQTLPARSK